MEIKKDRTLTHLLLSSYTIGFVLGCLTFFITERNIDYQFSFSIETIFSFVLLLPIIYWGYRYSGMVFNKQHMKVKLLYIVLWIVGMYFGLIFFELVLK
ncbi:hypothetical protein ACQKNX_06235 [Lysinibacillus sp. NPDC093712]|uniref:hypothetical protein n=1 Tax=Lysinibacillus sp. NPDC093712 TaxID=3390579 RepID=UPI003CFEA025